MLYAIKGQSLALLLTVSHERRVNAAVALRVHFAYKKWQLY